MLSNLRASFFFFLGFFLIWRLVRKVFLPLISPLLSVVTKLRKKKEKKNFRYFVSCLNCFVDTFLISGCSRGITYLFHRYSLSSFSLLFCCLFSKPCSYINLLDLFLASNISWSLFSPYYQVSSSVGRKFPHVLPNVASPVRRLRRHFFFLLAICSFLSNFV